MLLTVPEPALPAFRYILLPVWYSCDCAHQGQHSETSAQP